MKHILTGLLLFGTLAPVAMAAPQISPQRIIVNPIQTSLEVNVSLNKAADNSGYATYVPGEKVQIKATVNEDAYLYIFSVDVAGEVTQIFPNDYAGDNFVAGGQTVSLPGANDDYTLETDSDIGVGKVFAVASRNPLDFNDILDIKQNAAFAVYSGGGQDAFAREVSGILNSIADNDWNSDVALYRTRKAEAASGELKVVTNANNAQVYLDGRLVGDAGVTLAKLTPGSYQLKVVAPGYVTYSAPITIKQDRLINLTVNLRQTPSTKANLNLVLNVKTAKIYMNGQYLGNSQNGKFTTSLLKNKQYKVSVVAQGYTNFAAYVKLTGNKTLYINLRPR
ncbi:DUF4384 domain-containing protein [Deinococcus roseus]|uniref:S-layer protein n=1 Tax=Deinococcus roseus TaxID=392414 RepID=A0ABQ2CX35_9DEIO|nr:DUF4384 domain-containing protein [Deinococcus roseus]GGJ29064.1 hypothetical protein GCM10008938_13950 [Deinococcus roseus]